MLGISLLEVVLVLAAFCLVYWLIWRFAKEPYRKWFMIVLAVFAVIYVLERLGVFRLLQSITI